MRDGRIVLVYNHAEKERSPLNLAISRTGEQLTPVLTLENEPGEFSYPAVIRVPTAIWHITYTWNRKKIRHVEVPLKDIPDHLLSGAARMVSRVV